MAFQVYFFQKYIILLIILFFIIQFLFNEHLFKISRRKKYSTLSRKLKKKNSRKMYLVKFPTQVQTFLSVQDCNLKKKLIN